MALSKIDEFDMEYYCALCRTDRWTGTCRLCQVCRAAQRVPELEKSNEIFYQRSLRDFDTIHSLEQEVRVLRELASEHYAMKATINKFEQEMERLRDAMQAAIYAIQVTHFGSAEVILSEALAGGSDE
jgi:hypothetical protein